MSGTRPLLGLIGALGLPACAAVPVPPSGPTVLAMPSEGKDLGRFRQEDANCRKDASAQIGYGTPGQAANPSTVGGTATVSQAPGPSNARASTYTLQRRYDQAYTQCMASAGNRVQSMTAGYSSPDTSDAAGEDDE
jgi:hypothetical protein